MGSYQDALAWLYGRRRQGAPRTHRRATELLAALSLDSPRNVVHVVGTNGKGEAATRIARALYNTGYRTVRFTSPHARSFCERVVADGKPITRFEVAAFVEDAAATADRLGATFFDLTLALAVWKAERTQADWFVAEAGVGAEGDATMALSNVRLVVATNVSTDHEAAIGPGVAEIALNKSHAIRNAAPVVSSVAWPEAAAFEARARKHDARFIDVTAREGFPADANAALAVAACEALNLPDHACTSAAEPAGLPCRWETFALDDGRELVFDGAHNVAALKRAVSHLRPNDHVLFGAQEQKDVAGMLRILEGQEHVTTTAVGDAPEVLRTHRQFTANPHQALAHAVAQLAEGERLVVLGSFRLVGSLSAPYAETNDAPSEGKHSQNF